MGVADQLLLNQVTIFNQQPKTTSYERSLSSKTKQEDNKRLDTDKYAFGWSDPNEIYKERK